MKQLQIIIVALTTIVTLQANAQSMTGFLDLRSLGGNEGSGRYSVGVELFPNDTAELEIEQHVTNSRPGDEPARRVCLTEITMHAGKVQVMLTDLDKDNLSESNEYIDLFAQHWDKTESCTSLPEMFSKNITFSGFLLAGKANLKYAPPAGFDRTSLGMVVRPYGDEISLLAKATGDGRVVVENLRKQLAEQLQNGSKAMFYNLYAETEELDFIDLDHGYIELK